VKNPFEKAAERERECPDCRGSGKTSDGKTCRRCEGKGVILVR